jgi:hypothetical protein
MQIDFFATDEDLLQVWKWLFDVPDMMIFEDHSNPDQLNRWHEKWQDICQHFLTQKSSLAAWSKAVGGVPRKKLVTFDQQTQLKLGAKGRTVLESPALIHIYSLGEVKGCLGNSSLKCLSEKTARKNLYYPEEFCNEVDWTLFRSIVMKTKRQLQKTCKFKLRNVPIMPDAFAKFESGQLRLWNWGEACTAPSPFISS